MKYLTGIMALAFLTVATAAKAESLYKFNSRTAELTSVNVASLTPNQKSELKCLALNIYHEARGSTEKDQMAVGFVTRNRQLFKAQSICDVVYEKHYVKEKGRTVAQFSWTGGSVPNKMLEIKGWDQAQTVAYHVLFDPSAQDITFGATYFHERTISPGWSKHAVNRRVIGSHLFFNLANQQRLAVQGLNLLG